MPILRFSYFVLSAATITASVAIPLLLTSLNASNIIIGATVSLFSLVMGLSLFFWGKAYQRYHSKVLLALTGALGTATIFLLMTVVEEPLTVMILRVMQAFFLAATTTILSVGILVRYRRNRELGMVRVQRMIGGGGIVGLLASYWMISNYSIHAIFISAAVLSLLSAMSLLRKGKRVESMRSLQKYWRRSLSSVKLMPRPIVLEDMTYRALFFIRKPRVHFPKRFLMPVLIGIFLLFVSVTALFTFLPIYVSERFGLEMVFPLFFAGSLAAFLTYPWARRVIRILGRKRTLGLGLMLKVVVHMLFLVVGSLSGVTLLFIISGASWGLIAIAAPAVILFDKKKEEIPGSLSAYQGMTFLGTAVGPIVGGIILAVGSYTALFVFSTLIATASLGIGLWRSHA